MKSRFAALLVSLFTVSFASAEPGHVVCADGYTTQSAADLFNSKIQDLYAGSYQEIDVSQLSVVSCGGHSICGVVTFKGDKPRVR